MKPSKEEWLELLSRTMNRWRDAQQIATQDGKNALEAYLNDTDCPLCKRVNNVCSRCIVSDTLGANCHDLPSYKKLVVSLGAEAINEAIQLMFVDMNLMYDKLEGGDTDETIDDGKAV